jgi:hypothetical protein
MTDGSRKGPARTASAALLAGLIAIPLIAMPLSFAPGHGRSLTQALANGNGHGGENGNGHGNAGGNGNGNGNVVGYGSGGDNSNGNGDGPAAAGKHAEVNHVQDAGLAASEVQDDGASGLGALNAAHASPQALANAAPNSRVGRIEIYAGSKSIRRLSTDISRI